ncbi:MAG TPA: hypothetical protein VF771_08640 [Longimicrobiaceae bacterium]
MARLSALAWARIGITIQFLALVRTLAEPFRLDHVRRGGLTWPAAQPYVTGAIIAAVLCWLAVALYFFRRFRLAAAVSAATVLILLAYKLYALG